VFQMDEPAGYVVAAGRVALENDVNDGPCVCSCKKAASVSTRRSLTSPEVPRPCVRCGRTGRLDPKTLDAMPLRITRALNNRSAALWALETPR
jgi:hypothetical protein